MNSNNGEDRRYLYNSNNEVIVDDNGKPMLNVEYLRHSVLGDSNKPSFHAVIDSSDSEISRFGIRLNDPIPNTSMDETVNVHFAISEQVDRETVRRVTDQLVDKMAKASGVSASHFGKSASEAILNPDYIPNEQILSQFKRRFGRERMLQEFIRSCGLTPTNAALVRVIDFINATCYPSYPDEDDYDEENFEKRLQTKIQSVEDQLAKIVEQLNELNIVSKARLIYLDYPETASISVQLRQTFDIDDDEKGLAILEDLIMHNKPKGLIEIEVSLTNKVVY